MSDRDEVRRLAEEILRLAGPTTHLNYPAQPEEAERRLLAFLAQRESALQGQLHRALGELAGLRGEIAQLEAWRVSETSARISDVTEPSHGALSVLEELEVRLRSALTASPLSERAGALIRSALAAKDYLIPGTEGQGAVLGSLARDIDLFKAELAKGGECG